MQLEGLTGKTPIEQEGNSIESPDLSHHRAYRSVHGGSLGTHSFSPCICHIYYALFRIAIGLHSVVRTHPSA